MSLASELYENFKHAKLEKFEFQRDLFDIYRYGIRTPEFIEEIFSVIEDSMRTSTQDLMWSQFFVSDRDMYKRINLLDTRLLAECSLKDYMSETQAREVLLKMIAGTAYTSCSRDNDDTRIINLEIKRVWLDVFKEVPEFAGVLEGVLSYWNDWHITTRAQYADYYARIEEHKNKPVIVEYALHVPIKFMSDGKLCSDSDLQMNSCTYRLIDEIVTHFNEFGIEGYMGNFGKKCIKSQARFAGGLIFKFDYCELLSEEELQKFKTSFCGQLSEGWGENMSSRKILIDAKLVNIEFDVDNILEYLQVENKLEIRPNM